MLKEDVVPIYDNYMAKKNDIILNFNTDNNINNENMKTENEDENKSQSKRNVLSESSKDDNIYNKKKELKLKESISSKINISEDKQSDSEREKIIDSFVKSSKNELIEDDRKNFKKQNNVSNM